MELIGKQIAIETILGQPPELHYPSWYAAQIEKLPPAPPEYLAEQAGILVTDADTISRQAAIDALDEQIEQCDKALNSFDISLKDEYAVKVERASLVAFRETLEYLPPAQPDVPDINVGDINKFIDSLEEIFADIRERHVDDSVCGLCEYDGAYIGQSGDWCNECPGFDRDDCFKLSDKCRKRWIGTITKALPSAHPETAKRIVGKSRDGMTLWYQCDMCNEPVDVQDNFCRECGRRLIDE